jgi:hypothetical protein
MTSTDVTLSARARRMADSLAAWPRRRVQLAELWELLDQIDPSSRMDVRRRRILSELITELRGQVFRRLGRERAARAV